MNLRDRIIDFFTEIDSLVENGDNLAELVASTGSCLGELLSGFDLNESELEKVCFALQGSFKDTYRIFRQINQQFNQGDVH